MNFNNQEQIADLSSGQLPQSEAELTQLMGLLWSLAQKHQGDSIALLRILRLLEQLHRQIQEELFQPTLPDTRQKLAHFLREIEESGGWPYIERMRIQELLIYCQGDSPS